MSTPIFTSYWSEELFEITTLSFELSDFSVFVETVSDDFLTVLGCT